MNLQQKWENVLETLREDFSTTVYEAWFEPLQALSIDETQHILYLGCHRDYVVHHDDTGTDKIGMSFQFTENQVGLFL